MTQKQKEAESASAMAIIAACAYEQSTPLVITNDERKVVFINKSFEKLTGWKSAKMVNGPVWNLLPKEQRETAKKFFGALSQQTGEVVSYESRWTDKDEKEHLLLWSIKSFSHQGKMYFIGSAIDVTDHREAQKRLLNDPITGLFRNSIFEANLERALAQMNREDGSYHCAVIYLDLDKFSRINHSLGAMNAEQVLKHVADKMRQNSRDGDTLVRFGGDKYGIILDDLSREEDSLVVAEKIRQAINESVTIENISVAVSASIGVVMLERA